MPHSLKAKIKSLCYKGIITDKERDRLITALDSKNVLDKIKERGMTTITYTYDETKPTNKDYLIAALTDSIDDGGASYESAARYNIDCPYYGNSDCLNKHEGNEYETEEYKKGCVRCKIAWLDREYDTYPADDGIWEWSEE